MISHKRRGEKRPYVACNLKWWTAKQKGREKPTKNSFRSLGIKVVWGGGYRRDGKSVRSCIGSTLLKTKHDKWMTELWALFGFWLIGNTIQWSASVGMNNKSSQMAFRRILCSTLNGRHPAPTWQTVVGTKAHTIQIMNTFMRGKKERRIHKSCQCVHERREASK